MIFPTEELSFENLTSEQVHHLVPERPLGGFSWDNPAHPIALFVYGRHTYESAVHAFYQRLCFLRCAQNTRHAPTDAEIECFTIYLIDHQRAIPKPSDSVIDYVYVLSCLAVAWLVLVKDRHPNIAKDISGLDAAIHSGFKFIFQGDLPGRENDSNWELLESVEYLALGATFSFIEKNKDRYALHIETIDEIESLISGKMSEAEDFAPPDTYARQRALKLIRGGDRDDSLVCLHMWHQWQLSQTSWAYNQVLEIAPSIAARSVFPSIKSKTMEVVQQLREGLHDVKPELVVFGQRRQFESDPIEIELDISFDDDIDRAIEEIGAVSWVDTLSSAGFMKALSQSFLNRMKNELNRHFAATEEFHREGFSIGVAKMQQHKDQFRIFLSAHN